MDLGYVNSCSWVSVVVVVVVLYLVGVLVFYVFVDHSVLFL